MNYTDKIKTARIEKKYGCSVREDNAARRRV